MMRLLLLSTLCLSRTSALALSRRDALWTTLAFPTVANAAGDIPDSLNVDNYLRSGFVSNPMGVSGQAGKSRPETGVLLRDGSQVARDRTGNVAAEIVLDKNVPVLASYNSPWPLATGTVFDVECRDPNTGDGAFLAVTPRVESIDQVKDAFLIQELFKPTGRFSFYGQPTDIKVKSSSIEDKSKVLEVSFSTLSQSTQTEIPRRARIRATIPEGTHQAVVLVASASAARWKKGSADQALAVTDSLVAIPAPQTSLKVRTKERTNSNVNSSV